MCDLIISSIVDKNTVYPDQLADLGFSLYAKESLDIRIKL